MTVDTHRMCEEKNCHREATHVLVWLEWAARLCESHLAPYAAGAHTIYKFKRSDDAEPAPHEP